MYFIIFWGNRLLRCQCSRRSSVASVITTKFISNFIAFFIIIQILTFINTVWTTRRTVWIFQCILLHCCTVCPSFPKGVVQAAVKRSRTSIKVPNTFVVKSVHICIRINEIKNWQCGLKITYVHCFINKNFQLQKLTQK